MFKPLRSPASTHMLTQEGDTYYSGKKMLYPSPASGRGDRIFLMTHIMVHVLSIILSIAFVSNVADHAQSNNVEGDYFAAVMSLLLLLIGVVTTLTISLSSKYPFENHGVVTAFMLWAYIGAFSALIMAFSSLAGTLVKDHSARLLGLWCALSQSLGIAFLFSGYINGLAASNRDYMFNEARTTWRGASKQTEPEGLTAKA